MEKTILITGGAGFIGTKLSQSLLDRGYKVIVADLVAPKIKHNNLTFEKLDVAKQTIPEKYTNKLFGIIHLSGKNIFGMWTSSFKKEVYNSRVTSTQKIVNIISKWQIPPEVLASASAFGFYGNKNEIEVNENETAGNDFLAKVCLDWENASREAGKFKIRNVQIRTAHVLGNGGLLAPLFIPFKFGFGAWLGSGKAWLPWVHISDIVNIYIFALENKTLQGPLNTSAPEAIRQKDFMAQFADTLGKKVLFSIPIFLLYLRYGGLALTFENSVKMSSNKLTNLGFKFAYPRVSEALKDVVKRT